MRGLNCRCVMTAFVVVCGVAVPLRAQTSAGQPPAVESSPALWGADEIVPPPQNLWVIEARKLDLKEGRDNCLAVPRGAGVKAAARRGRA